MSCAIINNLPGIEGMTYLELGLGNAQNFNSINAGRKTSVDIHGGATFVGTTDQYFETLSPDVRYDIIFIDANHDYDYVLRDFNNSVERCNKWLILHDMVPPSEGHTSGALCSDSFRVLYHMLKFEKFELYTMDTNFGLTLIRMPATKIQPSVDIRDLTWTQFMDFLAEHKLYNNSEVTQILQSRG